jgi:hypothetical protein
MKEQPWINPEGSKKHAPNFTNSANAGIRIRYQAMNEVFLDLLPGNDEAMQQLEVDEMKGVLALLLLCTCAWSEALEEGYWPYRRGLAANGTYTPGIRS